MILKSPFQISARLLPALHVGGAWVQLEHSGWTHDRRARFRWTIDLANGKHCSGNDLKSGVGGCTLQAAFESLLAFLTAAESNADLFPAPVVKWAAACSEDLALLGEQIRETPGLIT